MNLHTLSPENLKDATRLLGHTLVGVNTNNMPVSSGNCFSVKTKDDTGDEYEGYRIVNFVWENMECLLLHKVVNWPIRIAILRGRIAIIHDDRIPDNWYQGEYCEVCCPDDLLPFPQIAAHKRQESRGERVVHERTISYHFGKAPRFSLDKKP